MADKNVGDEAMIAMVLFFIALAGFSILVWYFFHAPLSRGVAYIRQGQMEVASLWTSDRMALEIPVSQDLIELRSRHRNQISDPRVFGAWRNYLPRTQGEYYKFKDLGYLSQLALQPYKYIVAVLILLMGLHAYKYAPRTKFRRKLDLNGLLKEQANSFPQIKPFIDFNPADTARSPGDPVPINLPAFSEALGPEEWVAHKLIPMPDGKMDRSAANKAFSKQLGKRWRGAKALPEFMQIMLAAFILKASRKRVESDDMLGRLAACWSQKGGLSLVKDMSLKSDALKVLRNKQQSGPTYNIMRQHAYETTAMMRALDFARSEGGVLAPAQFLWLRGYDRNLWYALNNIGRQTYHPEALGAMAHYKNEKRTSRPIPVAKVDEAVDTLAAYIESSDSRPIPEVDYGKTKQDGKTKGVLKPKGSK